MKMVGNFTRPCKYAVHVFTDHIGSASYFTTDDHGRPIIKEWYQDQMARKIPTAVEKAMT